MVQKLIFLVICLFYFPHFCNAFAGDKESPIVAVKHHIPSRYATRHGDLASELAEDPLIISDNPKIYLHAILLALGEKCLEASKMILSCAPKAALKFLPDCYSPIAADENHLVLYDHLTNTTSPFPRIEIKKDLLLLALSYAEASDRCLPREIKLRISRSERLKDAIFIACADSFEVAAHHEIRPFKFSTESREALAPYCLYYKNLYEGLVNKEQSYTEFLAGLKYLMENAVILRPTPDRHIDFEKLPLRSLLEDYIRLKDSWTQRYKAVTEPEKWLSPPSLAKLKQQVDKSFEKIVQFDLKMLSQQVSILQAINTQLKECVSTYQGKLLALRLSSSNSHFKPTAILSIESTPNVIENVRVFIEGNYSCFAEAYRERITRLYSLVGTLKATESPLAIPNFQNIIVEGPHFDPSSFVEVGKQLEQIRNDFRLLAHDLKERELTSLSGTTPLPRASKSKSTTFFWRQRYTPSQTHLGSTSTPSISHSISTITSTSSSEDEATLSPQASPTPTTSSSNSQGTS
ncbi:MAG: hypothetical protein K2X02_00275 [Alphaproteobacteria bacterium]|nr:hypothetical protein [Alphaproteobacteria bacterium]